MDFVKATLSKEDILKILELYPLDFEYPDISNLSGVANSNYRIIDKNIDVALKVYSHGQSDRNKIEKELEVLKLFFQRGIKVPELIYGKDKKSLQTYKGFSVVATKFIEGQVFDSVPFTPEKMFKVGELVARVENAAKHVDVASFDSMSFKEEFEYVSKNLKSNFLKKGHEFNLNNYRNNLNYIYQVINKLDSSKDKYFLHKDIWPWNLIDNKDGIYLLDFNDWSIGNQIIELSVPLLEFSMFKSNKFDIDIAENIVRGYKSIKPLLYNPSELWESMLFICYLYFPYNVIQAESKFESEIYLKRIDTLLNNPNILSRVVEE